MNEWRTVSQDGNTVTLKRFVGLDLKCLSAADLDESDIKIGCAVDLETTGFDRRKDSVIEIGIQIFFFEANSGKIIGKGESLSQLQDPGRPLLESITRVTGIKTTDVKGQKIDWQRVGKMIDSANLVVAHNAFFDRSFIDRYTRYSSRPVWACTMRQIDWIKYESTSTNLQMLMALHGFFFSAHRASIDVQALVHLLCQNKQYMRELYKNAHAPRVILKLKNTPFESRLLLRELNYRWEPIAKTWTKSVLKDELKTALSNLAEVYQGREPQYETVDIPLSENFKVYTG